MAGYTIEASHFGDYLALEMPAGTDMIIVCADRYQHVPIWIGLPHQLYVETARNLMRENFCSSLTVVPYRNADKIKVVFDD